MLAVDGSTLDVLVHKVGQLCEASTRPLAGRMTALLDLCSLLPRQVWSTADALAHDQRFWVQIHAAVPAEALLLFDLGYTNFAEFARLTLAQVTWITRAKTNLSYQTVKYFQRTSRMLDALI